MAPALGSHQLMGEAEEGRRDSEGAMWLAAFSVGTRRASCGRCHATKNGDTDREQRWKEGPLSRAEGSETASPHVMG